MKTKKFDCIAMKRDAAARIYEQLKDVTPAEQYAYWKTGEGELRAKCRDVIVTELPAKAA